MPLSIYPQETTDTFLVLIKPWIFAAELEIFIPFLKNSTNVFSSRLHINISCYSGEIFQPKPQLNYIFIPDLVTSFHYGVHCNICKILNIGESKEKES